MQVGVAQIGNLFSSRLVQLEEKQNLGIFIERRKGGWLFNPTWKQIYQALEKRIMKEKYREKIN
jgi:hypothetical protein